MSQNPEALWFPGVRATSSFESPDLDAGNRAWDPWKSGRQALFTSESSVSPLRCHYIFVQFYKIEIEG